MITLNASGGSVTFTFSGNSTYLNDGTITVPVNSLALIIDESDMATFKKAASNDIFVSANIAEFGMTKDELISWYKENMVGSTGGGGEVSSAITENDTNAVAGGAVYDKVHVTSGETSETVLTFEERTVGDFTGMYSTNYPSGVATIQFEFSSNTTVWASWSDANDKVLGMASIAKDDNGVTVNFNIIPALSMSGITSYTNNVLTIEVTGFQNASPTDIASIASGSWGGFSSIKAVEGESVEYWIKDYVDAKVAEAGECTVQKTVVYDRNTNRYTDYYGDNKLTYAVINYSGDKSQAFNMPLGFSIGDASSDLANSYIYFDYVNHSASTDISTDYLTVEYINDIQDFKVSITSAYQSDYWIKDIYNLNSEMAVLIPYYTINSGSPCTVITTDVVGLVEKVKGDVNSSTRSVNLESSEKNLSVTYYTNAGASNISTIGLEEIDGTNNKLKPNIKVDIGVSGWTEIAFNGTCNTNGNPKSPIIRLSGDTNSLDAFNTQWLINLEHYGNTYDSVIWSGSEFVFNSNWFGENGELGTATVTYDDANNTLTIAYPLTAQVGDYTDNVEMSDIYNQNCQFGTAITKLEYYGELQQALKPYVQETRAALGGLSLVKLTQAQYDALAAKDDNTLYVVIPNP